MARSALTGFGPGFAEFDNDGAVHFGIGDESPAAITFGGAYQQ
jgi:hypothetical protein